MASKGPKSAFGLSMYDIYRYEHFFFLLQVSSESYLIHILRSFRILKYTFQGTVPNFSGKYFSSQKSVNILLLNNESSYSTYLKGESTVHI